MFDTLILFLKEYFEKSNVEIYLQTKILKNYPECKELTIVFVFQEEVEDVVVVVAAMEVVVVS